MLANIPNPINPDEFDFDLEPIAAPPALILTPVSIVDFVQLVTAAYKAARSVERFVSLFDPQGIDLRALEQLQKALTPFYPANDAINHPSTSELLKQ